MNPFQAAIEGTREIGLAVLATSLSLMAVFVPIGFMQGIVGKFMSSFGLTASFAVAVSLIVSFTLTPMLAARLIRPRKTPAVVEGRARKRRRHGRRSRQKATTVTITVGSDMWTAYTLTCCDSRWRIGG